MTNMQLQRESLYSANLDTVPQKDATTAFDAEWYRQLPRRIAPHLIARKVLGEGGTAIVVGAFHTRLKLPVAVKILKLEGESSAEAALRMQREAELCARLDSPRFPRIYDVDSLPDGTPYVVMEEVHGRPLDELLSHGPLELDLAVAIVCEVLEGLAELHAAGVIHRDIKPSNLILEEDSSGSFRVRMLDLGIAKSMTDTSSPDPLGKNPGVSLTQRGCLLGTPHYMSSEQLMGAPIDQRTDLYSVGVLLYETLSGRLPYQGDTAGSVIAAALRDLPPPLRTLRSDLPEELEYIVSKAMERDRDQRFSSAAEMLLALRAVAPQRLNTDDSAVATLALPFAEDPTEPREPPSSGLRIAATGTNSAQAWAARALHSVPPEPPLRQKRWAGRLLLGACAVLAGVVAWPAVTSNSEPSMQASPSALGSTAPVAATPFVPALTEPPRPEDDRTIEHIDLLPHELALPTVDSHVYQPLVLDSLQAEPSPAQSQPIRPESRAARPESRRTPSLKRPAAEIVSSSEATSVTKLDSAEAGKSNSGVLLNSYVEELDRAIAPADAPVDMAPPSGIPENPYQD